MVIIMLHDETRKLLIEAWNKTHNAKEIAECFSVNTSTVYRLEKRMRETGSVKTRTSQRGRKHALQYNRSFFHTSEWRLCLYSLSGRNYCRAVCRVPENKVAADAFRSKHYRYG